MASITNVILKDRAPTPVNHTFTPRGVEGGTGLLTETSGVPFGAPSLSVSMRQSKQTGGFVGRLKLSIPVVENQVVNGVSSTVVSRVARADLQVTFDKYSTDQERKNLLGELSSALDPTQTFLMASLVNLEAVW